MDEDLIRGRVLLKTKIGPEDREILPYSLASTHALVCLSHLQAYKRGIAARCPTPTAWYHQARAKHAEDPRLPRNWAGQASMADAGTRSNSLLMSVSALRMTYLFSTISSRRT